MFEQLRDIISGIDWKAFHFLRPRALHLFWLTGVVLALFLAGSWSRRRWKSFIPAHLRPYMFSPGSLWSSLGPFLVFLLASACIIFALAGPAWKKKEIPHQKVQAVVLVVMDLSRSMLAVDVLPSRLERAKFKINDFLDANPRAKAGLVAYAGTAHPVLPFTGDYQLVKHHAVNLANRIMPVQGSNTEQMLAITDSLMRKVTVPSTVFLLTDIISQEDAAKLAAFFTQSIHRLEILLVSTGREATVPGHGRFKQEQDPSVLTNLVQDSSVHVTAMTLDKSDVTTIAGRISSRLIFENEKDRQSKEWEDRGWLLVFPALFLVLLWFRKGWVLHWAWLPLVVAMSSCGVNSRHPDWWYSKDYQGALQEKAGHFNKAAGLYEDDVHKATAYYKAGNFARAAELFAIDTSATGQYNYGLTLAQMGRYGEAVIAFNKAISLDPQLRHRAEGGIAHAQDRKRMVDSVNRHMAAQDKLLAKAEGKKKGKKEKDDPLKERKRQEGDEELSSDTRVNKMPKFGNRITDEVETGIRKAREAKAPDKDPQKQSPGQIASQIMLREADADPGEFLHRRFLLQEKRYYRHLPKPKDQW